MKCLNIVPDKTGFDIDGVVADTMGSFIRIAKDDYGINTIKKENITSYWLEQCLPIPDHIIGEIIEKILADPFGTGLKPIPGAIETLEALAAYAPLTFVTARPNGKPIEEWLRKQLAGVPPEMIRVTATGEHSAKASLLKEIGISYFVEDHLETCLEIAREGITAIVFDQPWNRQDSSLPRAASWRELASWIRQQDRTH